MIYLATLHQPVWEGSSEGKLFVWGDAPSHVHRSPSTTNHHAALDSRQLVWMMETPEEEVAYNWFVFFIFWTLLTCFSCRICLKMNFLVGEWVTQDITQTEFITHSENVETAHDPQMDRKGNHDWTCVERVVRFHVHKIPSLVCVMSQMNLYHIITSCLVS